MPHPNAEEEAGCLSKLTFSFASGFLTKGWRSALDFTELHELPAEDHASHNHDLFWAEWQAQLQKVGAARMSVVRVLLRVFGRRYLPSVVLSSCFGLFGALGPLVLKHIILYITDPDDYTLGFGLAMVALLCFPTVVGSLMIQHSDHIVGRLSIDSRGALATAVYKKSLRLGAAAGARWPTGELANLIAVDAQRQCDYSFFINWVYICPVMYITASVICILEVGYAFFPGLLTTVLLLWLTYLLGKKTVAAEGVRIVLGGRRLDTIAQVLSGIQVFKLYGWEDALLRRINALRGSEEQSLKHTLYMKAAGSFLATATIMVSTGAILVSYIYLDSDADLSPAKVYTVLAVLYSIRVPLLIVPLLVPSFAQLRVSYSRLTRFLLEEEVDSSHVKCVQGSGMKNAIEIEHGFFDWNKESDVSLSFPPASVSSSSSSSPSTSSSPSEDAKCTLSGIQLGIAAGSGITMVIGHVNSGKSSLLHAMMGAVPAAGPDCRVTLQTARADGDFRFGYVPQTAWIINATVRENILMGLPYDEARYNECVACCALLEDLAQLSEGDATEIGERGHNLSGGQKQRVSLCRAIYHDVDAYLFDDPLSAVDPQVAHSIFHLCFLRLLAARGKPVVLVSSQLQFAQLASTMVVMHKGRIEAQGPAESLQDYSAVFDALMGEQKKVQGAWDAAHSSQGEEKCPAQGEDAVAASAADAGAESDTQPEKMYELAGGDNVDKRVTKKYVADELRVKGHVDSRVWLGYLGNCRGVVLLCTLLVCEGLLRVASDGWLGYWTSEAETSSNSREYYVGVYGALLGTYFLWLGMARTLMILWIVRSACSLHAQLLKSIVSAPMTFFDTTPSGRILSRFSRDVAVVDALLPSNVEGIYTTLLQLLGTVLLSIVAVPYMAIVLFLLCALYAYIQRYYSCSARELQRLESLKRSPVLTHFSETLDGRGTLRALGLGAAFEQKLIEVLDENSVTLYAQRIVERWLAVRLESMGATVSIFTALLSVIIAAHSKDLSAEDRRQVAALTGLALAYALALPGEMNWLVRQSVEFEARMNAVERIVEYSSIISERQGEEQAPRAWPASGAIEIKKLSVRYQPHLPLVLHEVSFEMKGGQKIGIVGRTGSGKSTLISCLFRLVDIEPGKILVDGVDIAALQLSELRKGLAVVPQNPVLFSGTLRDNIDPFGMFSDEEVRTAVEQSSLASTFTAVQMDESADSLQLVLSVGGSNLSQGQRQLVCLSRALLKRSQVLVLDEASSSVDMSTDASISQCIKQHFASATVITVAHRVHTIMESDVVLVLAGGHVVESGEPSVLASNPDSTFFKFIKGTE